MTSINGADFKPPRRGAPVPLTDDELAPPRHLTADERQVWREAVATRPGLFCAADLLPLEVLSKAGAFIRAAHRAGGVENPKSYAAAVRMVMDMQRVLRISVYDRIANVSSRVERPPLLDDGSEGGVATGTASKAAGMSRGSALPWARPS
jgi:hypothetical protein